MGLCMASLTPADEQYLYSLQPQFDALKLRPGEVRRLFRIFIKLDADRSGNINLKELMNHLEMGETVFRDRVFSIFDEDGSGQIDFKEFVLSLWNYCTLSKATLDLFAFDLYDTDSNGELSSEEIDGMLHDLYGHDVHTHPAAKAVSAELKHHHQETDVDIALFQHFVRTHPSLLFPAFQLQNALRGKILGVRFWENASERRIRLTEGRFVPISDFMELNVNNSLFTHELKSISASKVDANARYILANTGTLHYRHAAHATPAATPVPSPAPRKDRDSEKTVELAGNHHHERHDKFGSDRKAAQDDKEASAHGRSALDKVFTKMMKEDNAHAAHNVPLKSTNHDGSLTNTPENSYRKPTGGAQPYGALQVQELKSPDSFILNQVAQHRHSVKGSSKSKRERERRHTYDQHPSAPPSADVRNMLHDALIKKVAASIAVDDKNPSFYYGSGKFDRRPTLP